MAPSDDPLPRLSHFRSRGDEVEQRATYLELFFDLVFVFAVTQLAHVLLEDLTVRGALTTTLLLLVSWWAWIYTTWMSNWFDPDSVAVRLVLMVVMGLSLLMAVAIPEALGARPWLFAASFVLLQGLRNAFIVWATPREHDVRRSYTRILVWCGWVGGVWLIGASLEPDARAAVWALALVLDYLGPFVGYYTPGLGRTRTTDWSIDGHHFAERCHLFIIIALGESIVVAGATASDTNLEPATVAALVTAFVGTAALWWLYFDYVAQRSAGKLHRSQDTGRLARDGFTYLHIPIVAGVIMTAVGHEVVILHPLDRMTLPEAATVLGGPALYLLGHNLFRLRMVGDFDRTRLLATAVLAFVGFASPHLDALWVAALAVTVLVTLAASEGVRARRPGGVLDRDGASVADDPPVGGGVAPSS